MKNAVGIACLLVAVLGLQAGAVVIGDWENGPDGWINWSGVLSVDDPSLMPGQYEYASIGATRGGRSLHLNKSGWSQNLAIKLQDNNLVDDFMANTKLTIDLTTPATQASGWLKIEEILLNAEGSDWGDYKVVEPAFVGWGEGGGGEQTVTLEFDYSAYLADADVKALGRNPYWVELIITTNNDGVHTDFYWDNAQLVPEPATLSLLGLGAAALIRRKK